MTIWFSSDTHFGHENIIKYCDRPFKNVDHMNEVIIDNWNSVVSPGDTVYHLGDVALGQIDKSLACVSRLNGYKILILGNHDRPFMRSGKADFLFWLKRYEEIFDMVWHWMGNRTVLLNGQEFVVSHFPYTGDHTPTDRHMDARPLDDGITPLIHGHTHIADQHLTYSSKGTPQIHVGQDAHSFYPVSEDWIMKTYLSA
jgi:calcineurin-like phosphoesterase family protein